MICLLVYLIPQDVYQSMVFHHRINSIFISYVLLFADAKKVSACKFSFMLTESLQVYYKVRAVTWISAGFIH